VPDEATLLAEVPGALEVRADGATAVVRTRDVDASALEAAARSHGLLAQIGSVDFEEIYRLELAHPPAAATASDAPVEATGLGSAHAVSGVVAP
jgi:hypothetical protein